MHNNAVGYLLIGLLAISMLGCGGREMDSLPLVPVSGTITMEGKPLSGAEVAFIPIGDTKGHGATGFTNAEGKYELSASKGRPGVPVGEYRVVLNKLIMPDGSAFPRNSSIAPIESPARESLPPCYSNMDSTMLTAKVPEGGTILDFTLRIRGSK